MITAIILTGIAAFAAGAVANRLTMLLTNRRLRLDLEASRQQETVSEQIANERNSQSIRYRHELQTLRSSGASLFKAVPYDEGWRLMMYVVADDRHIPVRILDYDASHDKEAEKHARLQAYHLNASVVFQQRPSYASLPPQPKPQPAPAKAQEPCSK